MNPQDIIDTHHGAHSAGRLIEKNISDTKTAVAIFNRIGAPSLKWSFIRGHVEKNGQISTDDIRVVISSKLDDLLDAIALFADIPFLLEKNQLIYDDINAVDFLGKIYEDINGTKPDKKFYETYSKILSGNKKLDTCLIYKACPDAITPNKSRVSDVGYDLSIIRKVKDLNSKVALYDTGIKVRVPHGYYTEVVPRSSLSKSGYILANSVGIIDRSYNGNIYIALAKIDEDATEIGFPFRCCQMIFRRQYFMNVQEIHQDLEATARGEGGFGSTG